MTEQQMQCWAEDRARQATQHPDETAPILNVRGRRWSRGDHYRRKNNGIALRTYREITRSL